jgi:phosphatidate cytidylyltransferase
VNDLLTRVLTGAIFVIIITAAVFFNEISFGVVFSAIAVLTLVEFEKIIKDKYNIRIAYIPYVICGGCLVFGSFAHYCFNSDIFLYASILAFLILCITEIYRPNNDAESITAYHRITPALFGIAYICLPFALFMTIPYMTNNEVYQPELVFFPLLMIWVNDSFAYLCGVSFGKHKLFPRVSPKKTWEGLIGGGVLTISAAAAIAPLFPNLTIVYAIVVATIVTVFGTFGDLFESMLKRSMKIKDTGAILPGHGGLLDRFDSLLFVAPVLFIYLKCIN